MSTLDQLRQTFYEECEELLASLQESVDILADPSASADTKTSAVAAAFRSAHSIKGGGGAFGSERLVTFSHHMETVLDQLRSQALEADQAVVDVLFRACDHLADLVAAERDSVYLEQDNEIPLIEALCSLIGVAPPALQPSDAADPSAADAFGTSAAVDPVAAAMGADFAFPVIAADGVAPPPKPAVFAADPAVDPAVPAQREWTIDFCPTVDALRAGNQPILILRALRKLGQATLECHDEDLPALHSLDMGECYLRWTVTLRTDASVDKIAEPFAFIATVAAPTITADDGSVLQFDETGAVLGQAGQAALAGPAGGGAGSPGKIAGKTTGKSSAPASAASSGAPSGAASSGGNPAALPPATSEAETVHAQQNAAGMVAAMGGGLHRPSSSIRVDVDRIERLVNMVGELVITQAMLAQQAQVLAEDRFPMLFQGLEDLASHTRDLQESVMAIRAQPVKTAFARLPRLVRETAQVLGKKVRLQLVGEETEVDKTVVEGLGDPLMHLIRNAIDHGIEMPEDRRAAGKPEEGTVTVAAEHRSGRIVIQVYDDGNGINLEKVRKKAIARGLLPKGAQPSDEDLHEMLFQPGFSTVDLISNISGRGVGMDVVRSNVNALGGRILVRSSPGRGTAFALTLPLTLAVMDGMLLRVGEQAYVLPIANIVESRKPRAQDIHHLVGRGPVLSVRGHYVPLVNLGVLFQAPGAQPDPTKTLVVLAEAEDGARVALMVDSLVGQQQVVIKSLEQNYGQCDGISAATILGDGRVALILDVSGIRQMNARMVKGSGAAAAMQENSQ